MGLKYLRSKSKEVDLNDVDEEYERVENVDEVYEADVGGYNDCVLAAVFETVGDPGVSKCDIDGMIGGEVLDPGDNEFDGKMDFMV